MSLAVSDQADNFPEFVSPELLLCMANHVEQEVFKILNAEMVTS